MSDGPSPVDGNVPHTVSVVVCVREGARPLHDLVGELATLNAATPTPGGSVLRVAEVILVHDASSPESARSIRDLDRTYDWIKPVWLGSPSGPDAATIAGMASSGSEWIVTMDERGHHDPTDLPRLLDQAMLEQRTLVYGVPATALPLPFVSRLAASGCRRAVGSISGNAAAAVLTGYRLVLGEAGRSVAAYAGHGVHLDVALSWVAARPATVPINLRETGFLRTDGTPHAVFGQLRRMLLTRGPRSLRYGAYFGAFLTVASVVLSVVLAFVGLGGSAPSESTWLLAAVLGCGGLTLLLVGTLAQYVAVSSDMAMGRPLYVITTDRDTGPLGRLPRRG